LTDVEYTEKALEHLEDIDPPVTDRVLNKVDEAAEWTDPTKRLSRCVHDVHMR